MNFETYLNLAWNDHATYPSTVAEGFSKGSELIETSEQCVQMVGLVTHVMGEHLGQWQEGLSIVNGLGSHWHFKPGTEAETAILRSMEVLKIAADFPSNLDSFVLSDQIRILSTTASAIVVHNTLRARDFLHRALTLSERGLDRNDPANRALAIAGNNLACVLEEKKSRTESETELMVLAAHTGRKFWELAGTWLEVSIAEYRLAMTYLQTIDPSKALGHAQNNVKILRANQAKDYDLFFGYQALALAEKQKGNELGFKTAVKKAKQHFENLNEDEKSLCESGMRTLS